MLNLSNVKTERETGDDRRFAPLIRDCLAILEKKRTVLRSRVSVVHSVIIRVRVVLKRTVVDSIY